MDGRKGVMVALACLAACGCVTTKGSTEHNARTIVAFGDMQASGGFLGDKTPEVQAQFRQEAQLAYLEAIKLEPRYLPAYLGLARLQKASGDHVAALGTYQQALQIEERNAGLWHETGMVQCKLRQWDGGIGCLKKAIELDPGNTQYRSALGCSLVMAGQPNEGFALLAQISGEAKAHRDMAKLMDVMGMPDRAKIHLAEASRLDPARPAAVEPVEPEVRTVSHTTGAMPTIIQAGVVQDGKGPPAKLAAPIDLPPLPKVSIRSLDDK